MKYEDKGLRCPLDGRDYGRTCMGKDCALAVVEEDNYTQEGRYICALAVNDRYTVRAVGVDRWDVE